MNRRKAHFSFRQLNLDDGVMLVMGGSIPPISKLGKSPSALPDAALFLRVERAQMKFAWDFRGLHLHACATQ